MNLKTLAGLALIIFAAQTATAQKKKPDLSKPDPSKKIQTVEVSCGKCQFGMSGRGCHMAVKINGTAYYADGADIESFGEAHGEEGLCNTVKKAAVQGRVVNGRFKITYIKLLPNTR